MKVYQCIFLINACDWMNPASQVPLQKFIFMSILLTQASPTVNTASFLY